MDIQTFIDNYQETFSGNGITDRFLVIECSIGRVRDARLPV